MTLHRLLAAASALLLAAGASADEAQRTTYTVDPEKKEGARSCAVDSKPYQIGPNQICVAKDTPRVVVLPSQAPPSWTRVSFDALDGDHAEVIFDPHDHRVDLARSVVLQPGVWQVSFYAQPQPHPTSPAINNAWVVDGQKDFFFGARSDPGVLGRAIATIRDGSASEPRVSILFRAEKKRGLAAAIQPLGLQGGSPGVGQAQMRGFAASAEVPAALNDAFQALADIAVDKAETRALAAASSRLDNVLCQPDGEINKVTGKLVDKAGFILLPKSCQAIRNVRLRDLGASGKLLERSVKEDLTAYATLLLDAKLRQSVIPAGDPEVRQEVETAARMLSRLVLNAARDQGVTQLDAQALLYRIGRMGAAVARSSGATAGDAAVAVAAAVLAVCQERGACDAKLVGDIAADPAGQFEMGAMPTGPEYRALVPRIMQVVALGADVLFPLKNQPQTAIAERAFGMTMEALLLVAEGRASTVEARLAVDASRRLLDGVVARDSQQTLLATVDLVTAYHPQANSGLFQRAGRMLGTVASYASTYQKGPVDEGDRKAKQNQRKQALQAMVEFATDRSERDGDGIYSIGTNVGFTAFGYRALPGRTHDLQYLQLGLPMGVGFQKFGTGCKVGFHGQVSLLDLGQYVAFDKSGKPSSPRWDTLLVGGMQLGLLVGNLADPFVVGIDLRFAPALFPTPVADGRTGVGTASVGLFLGYYVPFLDLN